MNNQDPQEGWEIVHFNKSCKNKNKNTTQPTTHLTQTTLNTLWNIPLQSHPTSSSRATQPPTKQLSGDKQPKQKSPKLLCFISQNINGIPHNKWHMKS